MAKIMIILVMVCMLCPVSTSALSQGLKAKTEDGTDIMLLPDGTWEYVITEVSQSLPSDKVQGAKTVIIGKKEHLWDMDY